MLCDIFRQCEGEVCRNGQKEARGREEEDGEREEEEGSPGQHGKGQNKERTGPEGCRGEWIHNASSQQLMGGGTARRGGSALTL